MKNNNGKLNEGCLKIFKFLELLYSDNATYHNVSEIFKDDLIKEHTNNLHVVLNKYINTFRVFGIKITKNKNKYKLESSLYSMNFEPEDLKAISILINSSQISTTQKVKNNLGEFLTNILIRMNSSDKCTVENFNNNYDFSFYYMDFKKQIKRCEKICESSQMVKVVFYKNQQQAEYNCRPKEIIYDSKNAYLRVYYASGRENIDIPISNIISIEELPNIANQMEISTTVVYKLKNRLAKTYKLKENEYVDSINPDGSITVINKDEPFDKLLSRLMRYTYNCEIITPKFLREKMINLIEESLNQYNDSAQDSE